MTKIQNPKAVARQYLELAGISNWKVRELNIFHVESVIVVKGNKKEVQLDPGEHQDCVKVTIADDVIHLSRHLLTENPLAAQFPYHLDIRACTFALDENFTLRMTGVDTKMDFEHIFNSPIYEDLLSEAKYCKIEGVSGNCQVEKKDILPKIKVKNRKICEKGKE